MRQRPTPISTRRRRLVLAATALPLLAASPARPLAAGIEAAAALPDAETTVLAESLLARALEHLQLYGSQAAYADFTFGRRFKGEGLFVVVFDLQGRCLAHGGNPRWVGRELLALKDPEGRPFVRMAVDLARQQGRGWLAGWRQLDPETGLLQPRAMLLQRVGETLVASAVMLEAS